MKQLDKKKKSRSWNFKSLRRVEYAFIALLLAFVWLGPSFINTRSADAAQITARSLSISSGVPGATGVTYTFAFSLPTSANVQSIQFNACIIAVGTCGTVTGINMNLGTQTSNTFTSTTAFTRDAVGGGGCTAGAQVLCVKRTQATAETGAKTLVWGGLTNPTTANTAFYIRITTYSDTAWATPVDSGTVASAVVQTLTVNAAVAEILNFCVGSSTINDATTSVASDCTAVSGTSLNIGTLDSGSVNISPVNTNGGDNKNGVAMVRSNASTGVIISYDAVQQSTGTNHLGALRVLGSTCSASVVTTDTCFNSPGATQTAFTAGTESFGMTVGGVNCGSTSSYTCVYSSGSNNLVQDAVFVGGTNATTYGASAAKGFSWDETGAFHAIASSASSTIKAVDDETLMLRFAATPSITTPFGAYQAQTDFIAVPTY